MILKWKSGKILSVAALVLSLASLSSCLDLVTEIRLAGNGTVRAELSYTLEEQAAAFGRGFGTDDPWPLPLTERDFEQRILMHDGVVLKKYGARVLSNGSEEINVRLEAESLEALCLYLDLPMVLRESGDSSTLEIRLPNDSSFAEAGAESREIVDSLIGDSGLTLIFRPPSRPIEIDGGEIDGRNALLKLTFRDLLYGDAPGRWTIRW